MTSPFVRQDAWSLPAHDPTLAFYEKAVQAMKAKPATDPTSWSYQAAMHGTHTTPVLPLWNECRHQGWFFISWHRAYVYYFERIVRHEVVKLGGPKTWALPYWNYDGGGTHNQLPTAFRNATLAGGGTNHLFVAGRSLTGSSGLPSSVTNPAFAMSRPLFTGDTEFGGGTTGPLDKFAGHTGRVEQTPHNDVHVMVGGLMLDPATAAADPIFWLHHCNIDRLWWLWQKTHADPTTASWRKPKFPFFDVGGASVFKTSLGVLKTEVDLDYTYQKVPAIKKPFTVQADAEPAQWPAPWPKPPRAAARKQDVKSGDTVTEIVGGTPKPIRLVGATVRVTVPVDKEAAASLEAVIPSAVRQHRAVLEIDNVEADRAPGTVYGVFVNLPEHPSADDLAAHHVGNISLFGVERARKPLSASTHPHSMRFAMEITSVLDRTAKSGAWTNGEQVNVTLQPLALEQPTVAKAEGVAAAAPPAAHENTPITIGRMSIHYK